MPKKTVSLVVFCAVTLLLCSPRPAAAYLDPTSGSLILQLLLGGVAGLLMVLKLFWHRILSLFGLDRKADDPKPEDPA